MDDRQVVPNVLLSLLSDIRRFSKKMILKYFGCLAFLASSLLLADNYVDGAMTREQMENAAKGMRNACIPKTGADPAIVAGLRSGNFPEDEKFQCYLKCIMSMLKTMKNGRPILDPMVKQINMMMPTEVQGRSIAACTKCVAQDFNDNPCIAAWQFVKCQHAEDPEVFFFP